MLLGQVQSNVSSAAFLLLLVPPVYAAAVQCCCLLIGLFPFGFCGICLWCSFQLVDFKLQATHTLHVFGHTCKPHAHMFLQAGVVYEEALAALPTARMYSMYATYLRDMLAQTSHPQQEALSEGQLALVQQLLQLCKRAFQAGPLCPCMCCLPFNQIRSIRAETKAAHNVGEQLMRLQVARHCQLLGC